MARIADPSAKRSNTLRLPGRAKSSRNGSTDLDSLESQQVFTSQDAIEQSSHVETSYSSRMPRRPSVIERFAKFAQLKKDKEDNGVPPTSWLNHAAPSLAAERQEDISPRRGERVEPAMLAQKIRKLVDSLPPLTSLKFRTKPPTCGSDGRPIPPSASSTDIFIEPELAELLSSPAIMNGSDGRRQSIWSVLEDIGAPAHNSLHRQSILGLSAISSEDTEGQSDAAVGATGVTSDASSVMMYTPLIPTSHSVVELADVTALPIEVTGMGSAQGSYAETSIWTRVWPYLWPFSSWTVNAGLHQAEGIDPAPDSTCPDHVDLEAPKTHVKDKTQTIWVPSTTELSFEALWWGYRMYVPVTVFSTKT